MAWGVRFIAYAGFAAAQLPRACVKIQLTGASSCLPVDPESATNTPTKSEAPSKVSKEAFSTMKAGKRAAVQDQLLAEIRAIKSISDPERFVSA